MTITRRVTGNVFTSGCRDIAFGISAEGHNYTGFAGMVAGKYWHTLVHPGVHRLGEVLSHKTTNWTFHALVCHFAAPGGFAYTPKAITQCLNHLQVPDDREIACVMVGAGRLGKMAGADTEAILQGIEASHKQVAVYSLTR